MRAFLITLCVGLLSLSHSAYALFGNNDQGLELDSANSFVPVDQAFPFNYYQQDGKILIDWQVKEGYYLYQHSLDFTGQNLAIGPVEMENGQPYQDEFFGEVSIYTQPLFVQVPLQSYQDGSQLVVKYQGCAKAGFCYPPEIRVIDIEPFTPSADVANTANASAKTEVSTQPTSAPIAEERSAAQFQRSWPC